MADDKTISIKIEADTSDIEKSMKDVEKSADKMAKKVSSSGDKIEKSFDGLEGSLKSTKKQMANLTKNINFNNLANSMKKALSNITQQVNNTTKQIKSKLMNIKANVDLKTNISTSGSSEEPSGGLGATALVGGAVASAGAMGSQIAKQMAIMGETVKESLKGTDSAFSQLTEETQTHISKSVAIAKAKLEELKKSCEDIGVEFDEEGILLGAIQDAQNAVAEYKAKVDKAKQSVEALAQEYEKMQEWGASDEELEEKNEALIKKKHNHETMMKLYNEELAKEKELRKSLELYKVASQGALDPLIQKVIELGNKWEESKTKANARELANSITVLQKAMSKLGLPTGALQETKEFMEAWSRGNRYEGTAESLRKSVNEVKNLSTGMKEYVTELNEAQKENQETAQSNNLLTNSMNNLKKVIPNIKNQYTTLKNKVIEWQKAHTQASDKVAKSNSKVANSFKSMLSSLLPWLSIIGMFNLLKNSITASMDATEAASKFNVIFGSSAKDMNDWIKGLSDTLGISISQMQDFSSTIFNMAKNLGIGREESIEMSKNLSMLAQDMASLHNISAEDAFDKLRSYMAGSSETLYDWGVVATEANLQAFALSQGITKSYSAMSQAEKTALRYQFAMQGLAVANGNLADSMNTPTGRTKALVAALNQLKISLGNCITPIWSAIAPAITKLVQLLTTALNAIASVISAIGALFGMSLKGGTSSTMQGVSDMADAVGGIADTGSEGTGDMADNLADGASSAKDIKRYLSGLDELNLTPESSTGGGSGGSGGGNGGSGGSGGGGGSDTVESIIEDNTEIIEDGENKLEQWQQDIVNGFMAMWDAFKTGWDSNATYIEFALEQLKQAFANLGTAIKDFLIGAWNNGGKELITNLGSLSSAIVAVTLDISAQTIQAFANLFNYLNPETNKFTRNFIKGLNNLVTASEEFIKSLAKWYRIFLASGGQALLNVIGDICMLIGTTLVNSIATAISWVTKFMNSWVGHTLIEAVAVSLNVIAGAIKAVLIVVEKLTPLWSLLLIQLGSVAVISKVTSAFNILKTTVVTVVVAISKNLTGGGLVGVLTTTYKAILTFVYSTINAFNLLKQGVVGATLVAEVGKLPALFATAISSVVAWAGAMKGATIAATAMNVAGSITAGIMGLISSPIVLVAGAIVGLIYVVDKICQHFLNWQGICSWLKEKLGALWEGIKKFFGWSDDNKLTEEFDETQYSLEGLGDTIEETSTRFGNECSKMNEALNSVGIDSNKLGVSLDKAEQMYNESFNRMSKNARDYLDAVATGNEEVLQQMSADSGTYMEEILYTYQNMSNEEKAIFNATYGEIKGINDDWFNYTNKTYEEMVLAHSSMLQQIENNEQLSAQEKDRLLNEETEKFKQAQRDRLTELNLALANMDTMTFESEDARLKYEQDIMEERKTVLDGIAGKHSEVLTNAEDASKKASDAIGGAYEDMSKSEIEALESVDKALGETQNSLNKFKEESDKVAQAIPDAWKGIGQSITTEFTTALTGVTIAMETILANTRIQCDRLKEGLRLTFSEITSGIQLSMSNLNQDMTSQFTLTVSSIIMLGNQLKENLRTILMSISEGVTLSFTTIKTTITSTMTQILTTVNTNMVQLNSKVRTYLQQLQQGIQMTSTTIKNNINNTINNIKQTINNGMRSMKDSVNSNMDNMVETINRKTAKMVQAIRDCVSDMKKALDVDLPTPRLKMPHVKQNGSWNLETGATPSWSVKICTLIWKHISNKPTKIGRSLLIN